MPAAPSVSSAARRSRRSTSGTPRPIRRHCHGCQTADSPAPCQPGYASLRRHPCARPISQQLPRSARPARPHPNWPLSVRAPILAPFSAMTIFQPGSVNWRHGRLQSPSRRHVGTDRVHPWNTPAPSGRTGRRVLLAITWTGQRPPLPSHRLPPQLSRRQSPSHRRPRLTTTVGMNPGKPRSSSSSFSGSLPPPCGRWFRMASLMWDGDS